MANLVFPKGIEAVMDGTVDLDSDTTRVYLVRGYTYNSAHSVLSDITGSGATLVASDAQIGKTVALGVWDSSDNSFGTVAAGAACAHLIAAEDTGTASTSRVVPLIDTATGLPVTPAGGTISVTWDNGANKIFKFG
jgi:hydroxyethylthiazole kinase-like sugar kinase family protein